LGPWYFSLKHPEWKPPDPYFGVIWSTIFTLCAISGGIAWQAAQARNERKRIILLFATNAFLNIFWSAIYFKLQRPDWAVFEAVFLWLSILIFNHGSLVNLLKKPLCCSYPIGYGSAWPLF
jgi:tryptophan-rich sensory protein